MGSFSIWNRMVVSSNPKTFSWSAPSGNNMTSVVITIDGAASGSPRNQYHGDTPIADIINHPTYTISSPGNSGSYSVRSANTGAFYISVTGYYESAQGPSTISAGNITLGDFSAVTIGNSQGQTGLVHKVKWTMVSPSGASHDTGWITTSVGAGTATATIDVATWLPYMPTNARSNTLSIVCQTYKDGTYYGQSSTTCTVSIPDTPTYQPVIGSTSLTVGEPSPTNWYNNKPWKTKSTAVVSWSGITPQQGATQASWTLTGDSVLHSGDATYAAQGAIVTSIFATAGTKTFTLTVTDSRGQSSSASVTLYVADYNLPTITDYSCFRCDPTTLAPDPTSVTGGAKMNYSAFNTADGNSITAATISIYQNGDYHPMHTGTAQPNTVYSYGSTTAGTALDQGTRYSVRFSVTDALNGTTTVTSMIDTAYVFMRWDKTLNSFGFGSYPLASNGQNQVYMNPSWNLYTHGQEIIDLIHPIGSIYISVNNTSPATLFPGTYWRRISGRYLIAAGAPNANDDNSIGSITGGWNAIAGTKAGGDAHSHATQDHTLAINEIPQHYHGMLDWWNTSYSGSGTRAAVAVNGDGSGSADVRNNRSRSDGVIQSASNMTVRTGTNIGQPHNHGATETAWNLTPYFAVNMWLRVATAQEATTDI